MERIKRTISTALQELDMTPTEVSLLVGRGPDYLQGFLRDDSSTELPLDVRRSLASHLGLPMTALAKPRQFRYPTEADLIDQIPARQAGKG
jgi:hypothetical protein